MTDVKKVKFISKIWSIGNQLVIGVPKKEEKNLRGLKGKDLIITLEPALRD